MTTNNHFETTDTALATYIIVKGIALAKIDYSKPRYEFVFENHTDVIQDLAMKYLTGKASVDPAVFSRVNKKLLRILKNELQWAED